MEDSRESSWETRDLLLDMDTGRDTLEPGDATPPEVGDRTVLAADLDLSDWKGGLWKGGLS